MIQAQVAVCLELKWHQWAVLQPKPRSVALYFHSFLVLILVQNWFRCHEWS